MSGYPSSAPSSIDALQAFDTYEFDEDDEFEQGLAHILRTHPFVDRTDTEEVERVIGRSKAFYFSKKTGVEVDWEDYLLYKVALAHPVPVDTPSSPTHPLSAPQPQASPGSTAHANTDADDGADTLTFAQLQALIESGQTHLIPNNEIIPDGLNEANPSEAREAPRRKPWESVVSIGTGGMDVDSAPGP